MGTKEGKYSSSDMGKDPIRPDRGTDPKSGNPKAPARELDADKLDKRSGKLPRNAR